MKQIVFGFTFLRLEYHQGTSSTRISEITGEIEPYIPWKQKLFRYSVTTSVCFGLVVETRRKTNVSTLNSIRFSGDVRTFRDFGRRAVQGDVG